MNAFLNLGRWFFAIPFALFGLQHLMNAQAMAGYIPDYMPAKTIWVYFTGICLIAAAVSMLAEKYDKLGAIALALFLLGMVCLVHLPRSLDTQNGSIPQIMMLRDLIAIGGALMYAKYVATDRSVVG